jgi:hypothetical protein
MLGMKFVITKANGQQAVFKKWFFHLYLVWLIIFFIQLNYFLAYTWSKLA